MLKEITSEEATGRIRDPQVLILRRIDEGPKKNATPKYEFIAIRRFGTPEQIDAAIESGDYRFFEETI